MPGAVVADLKIARGLDYYTGAVYETQLVGLRVVRLGLLRRPLRLARQRRAHDVPRRRHLARRHRASCRVLIGRGLVTATRSVPTAVLVAVSDEATRGASEDVAAALRARGISTEVAPSAAKFGKQIRYADRRGIPFVWFRRRRRRAPVKDIRVGRPGRRRPRHLDARRPRTSPPSSRLASPDIEEKHVVIRTHAAGTLRAEHVGQTVTLAGWVARRRDHGGVAFIDLRDASGVVQVVVRDRGRPHRLRTEFCVQVVGVVSARPEGNENPDLATGEIEVVATDARGAQRAPRRCRSRSTSTSRSARRRGCGTATSTCAARRPARRIRLRSEVNRAARDVLLDARLRRDRDPDADPVDPRGRPRLPGARPAAARLAGTRCRRARSCSSSC